MSKTPGPTSANLDWLNGDSDGFRIRTGKLTGKAAIELANGSLRLDGFDETRDLFMDLFLTRLETGAADLLDGQKLVKALPPPLIKLREFESTPGLWVFDDLFSEITFLMWSDAYKVHPWKGTSYEILLTRPGQRARVREATIRFFRFLLGKMETPANL